MQNNTPTSAALLSREEKRQLLEEFNDINTGYSADETIISLFEQRAAQYPNVKILAFGKIELSYRELNEKSNQLANYLRANYDINADDLVGLLLNRGEWMVIAMLGVLKSGAAYVPVDPLYPAGTHRLYTRGQQVQSDDHPAGTG